MRIIGGEYRGRKIKQPEFETVRPTKDRIREAVFNIIAEKVPGSSVLDVFSGSGAYGIEALSRGAEKAVLIEKDERCCRVITENVRALGLEDRVRLMKGDAFGAIEELGQNKERFDLVFSDPPYSKDMAKKTLNSINHYDIVIASGLLVIEHHKGEELPAMEGGVFRLKQKVYKDTVISIYQRK